VRCGGRVVVVRVDGIDGRMRRCGKPYAHRGTRWTTKSDISNSVAKDAIVRCSIPWDDVIVPRVVVDDGPATLVILLLPRRRSFIPRPTISVVVVGNAIVGSREVAPVGIRWESILS
jgi:hypothetical protein